MLISFGYCIYRTKLKMELFVLLIAAIVAGSGAASTHKVQLSKEQSAKVIEYSVNCMKETGVKPELLVEAKKGNFADDENLKKFSLCFFKKTGILTADGKLDVDVALSKLPADVDKAAVKKVLEECKTKRGKNEADTAFEMFKCYNKGTPTHVSF